MGKRLLWRLCHTTDKSQCSVRLSSREKLVVLPAGPRLSSTDIVFFCHSLLQKQHLYEVPAMNQYHHPQTTLPPAAPSPTSSVSDMMGPPAPHMYYGPLEGKPGAACEAWPPVTATGSGPVLTSEIAASDSSTTPLCAGCRLRIEDKFYLSAVDVKWHSACLKCAECGVELETQSSCFERDGHIYCKEDYRR